MCNRFLLQCLPQFIFFQEEHSFYLVRFGCRDCIFKNFMFFFFFFFFFQILGLCPKVDVRADEHHVVSVYVDE